MAQAVKATKQRYRIELKPPHDDQIKITGRIRFFRLISCALSLAIIVGIPTAFFTYVGHVLTFPRVGFLLGFAVSGWYAVGIVVNRMLIYNAEWTGYVTQDSMFGGMVPYGPGLHLSNWWEVRNAIGNYSLKVIDGTFGVGISTTTSKVTVNGEYEVAINLAKITSAIGINPASIDGAIQGFINSFLTERCATETADTIRGLIHELNDELAKMFMGEGEGKVDLIGFFDTYGLIVVSIVINSISLPEAVQRTRDAIDESVMVHKVAAGLMKMTPEVLAQRVLDGKMSHAEYMEVLNRAMAMSDNATTIQVQVHEIPALLARAAKQFVGEKS